MVGTVTGDYTDTWASDNVYESIKEAFTGGINRAIHKWTIPVTPGGQNYVFSVEGYHDTNGTDYFSVEYSTDDVTYIPMVTITKTADDDAHQTFALPSVLPSVVYIRIHDNSPPFPATAPTATTDNRTALFIDDMFISSDFPCPTPSPTQTATPTPTRTATLSPTQSASPSPTRSATLSPTRTASLTPTRSATASPTRTATPTCTPYTALDRANADIPVVGTVTGDYTDTWASDNVYESIKEAFTGGINRAIHKWTIPVTPGGQNYVFSVEGYHDTNGTDYFSVEYSTDDVTYIPMVTITKTADDDAHQTFALPSVLPSVVYIRIHDNSPPFPATAPTATTDNRTALFIDDMFISSDFPCPTPSPTQTATPTPTRTATLSPTQSASPSPTRSATLSPTRTASLTPTRSATASPTRTASQTPTPCVPGIFNDYAVSDIPVSGVVSGDYTDTFASDNVYEGIKEVLIGGVWQLEHKWSVGIAPGSDVHTFFVEAFHQVQVGNDAFVFSYSTDDVTYTPMLTVTKTADDNATQTFDLPSSLPPVIYIRVVDDFRLTTLASNSADTINIDWMFVKSTRTCGLTPTPTRTSTPSPTSTVSPSPTRTATLSPTRTASLTPTASSTPSPTRTGTPSPTRSATATPSPTPCEPATYIDRANADLPVVGTVTGNYTNTIGSDNVYEGIKEVYSGGIWQLEHKWTIPITPGANQHVFSVEAFHTANGLDDVTFSYSTDGTTFIPMLVVTKTADDNGTQTFLLPSSLPSVIYIRVRDNKPARTGDLTADHAITINVDDMFVASSIVCPTPTPNAVRDWELFD